ncbi:hypothetical protein F5B17DRAFT_400376 [Nemania serpens]|nr:hypothetical protein F5B17DRAFT_400376 [Nemania serpens]
MMALCCILTRKGRLESTWMGWLTTGLSGNAMRGLINDLTTRDRWLSTAGCLKSATIDDEVLRLERKRLAAEPDHIARHVRRRRKSAGDGRRRKALVGTRDFPIDMTGCTS